MTSSIPQVSLKSVRIALEPVPFRAPLKFGGRVVSHTQLINAEVILEANGRGAAVGRGSMPVGNVWAWPSAVVSSDDAETVMTSLATNAAEALTNQAVSGDPFELGHALARCGSDVTERTVHQAGVAEAPPQLAALVALSPIDAAIHDAFGRLFQQSAFAVYSHEFCHQDLAAWLNDDFAGEYANRYVTARPTATLPLYHLVGALDPLEEADVQDRPGDGLPLTLPEWIAAEGITHFKIKLSGEDADWDIQRVLAVHRIVTEQHAANGIRTRAYSCDFNEKCDSEDYVLDFLAEIRQQSKSAFDTIQYIEQPTSRDLNAAAAATMHRVSALKPVVIDEALVSFDSLRKCRDLGYSGVALKACKGQTESVLMAAAAQKYGMFLCVQDLTCPGASFLHSASLAAHIPGVAAIEGNARQYCPAPNTRWMADYGEFFRIRDGTVPTEQLAGVGLGFDWAEL